MGDSRVDVAVVGAGLMGAATAWAAARRGLSVLVLEQFEVGHSLGSSHGSARIVRRGYGDPLYTSLGGRAFELWSALEEASGVPILRMLGGVDFGADRDVEGVAAGLDDSAVPYERLSPAEAAQRWPGMVFDGPVIFHPQAGTMDPDTAVRAFVAEAQRLGAVLRPSTEVLALRPSALGVTVETASGAVSARQVVVAAGAWVSPLLDGLVSLPPLQVTQQQVFHFPRRDTAAPPWPSVIHQDVAAGVHGIYHLAGGRDGGPGDDRKIGEHEIGTPTTAHSRPGLVDPSARERVVEYVRRWLPGLEPTPRGESTCLYTRTASEDFLIDRVGPVIVCSPCSGHGAKFAPLIGELACSLVTGSGPELPERFRLRAHAVGVTGARDRVSL